MTASWSCTLAIRGCFGPGGLSGLVVAGLFALAAALGPASASAQSAKSIAVAIGHEPRDLVLSSTSTGHLLQNLVFDRLVGLDDQLQPFPQLVTQIPTLDNGLAQFVGEGAQRHLEVTLLLRQGVTWSDGEPFTADDVVYQAALLRNPAFASDAAGVPKIDEAVRVDDGTVVLRYPSAAQAKKRDPAAYADQGNDPVVDPLYFFGLDPEQGLIYPSHVLRPLLGADPSRSVNLGDLRQSDLAWTMPGTGPYTLAGHDPGSSLAFAARSDPLPQRRGAPKIGAITFRVYDSVDDAISALDAGDVQAIASNMLEAPDVSVVNSLPAAEARTTLGSTWEQLTLNLDNPILADRRVRQAIAYALDRQALADSVMHGQAQVLDSQFLPSSPLSSADIPRYARDAARADELLRDAGWLMGDDGIRVKDGRRMKLNLWMTPATFRPLQAPLLQQQLRAAGIDLSLDFVPAQVFFAPTPVSPQSLVARTFDMAEFSWTAGADAGADARFLDHSRSIPTKQNGYAGGNYAGFRNARNDVLLDQGLRSLSFDFRRMAYGEAQQIWATELPIIPLYVRPTVVGASFNLLNCRPSRSQLGETWNVEEWDLAS